MAGRGGEMELKQDLAFQRREWTVQRIGWWALTALVGAAVLGIFGGGPLSRARAGEPGAPLWIEYERFARVGATTRLYVHLGAGGEPDDEVRVSRNYFDRIRVERLTPEPTRVIVEPDDVRLFFDLAPGGGERAVVFDVQPLRAGRHSIRIGTARQPGHSFTQIAYF
jgi:hypothetical protein